MKAAVYYKNDDIRVEEVKDVPVAAGEVKVKVVACGVCGSDVMEWYRIKRAGRPGGIGAFGHECTGDIVDVGSGVDPKWQVGTRVVVTHHVPCGTCPACVHGHATACHSLHTTKFKARYGAYAEYVVLPPLNVDRGILALPDTVGYDAGTFVEPLGSVLRGQRNANVTGGKSVLVIGAGLSGLLHLQAAQLNGAGFIAVSDVNPARLAVAERMGASLAVDAGTDDVVETVKAATGNWGVDVVIMTAPVPVCVQQALAVVAPGGTILFFAPTRPDVTSEINIWDLWQNEVSIVHSYGAAYRDLFTALQWIQHDRVDVASMITHRLPLARTSEGFQLTATPREGSLKVVVHPQE